MHLLPRPEAVEWTGTAEASKGVSMRKKQSTLRSGRFMEISPTLPTRRKDFN